MKLNRKRFKSYIYYLDLFNKDSKLWKWFKSITFRLSELGELERGKNMFLVTTIEKLWPDLFSG